MDDCAPQKGNVGDSTAFGTHNASARYGCHKRGTDRAVKEAACG